MEQTYQDVSRVIARDLIKLSDKKLNEISSDFQGYFYNLKQQNPKKYEGLTFTKDWGKYYSSDLEAILGDLRGNLIGTRLYIKKEKVSLYKKRTLNQRKQHNNPY